MLHDLQIAIDNSDQVKGRVRVQLRSMDHKDNNAFCIVVFVVYGLT